MPQLFKRNDYKIFHVVSPEKKSRKRPIAEVSRSEETESMDIPVQCEEDEQVATVSRIEGNDYNENKSSSSTSVSTMVSEIGFIDCRVC